MVQHPEITITYFDVAGKAEPTRLALTVAGIFFNDVRIKREDWPALKPKTPFGQLPTITINGETFAQSQAMLRYAGRLTDLYPNDPIKALQVDMVIDQVEDIGKHIFPIFVEEEPGKKKQLIKDTVKNKLPSPCSALDKYICKQGSAYAIGSSLTIADLLIYNVVSSIKSGKVVGFPTDFFGAYKNFGRVYDCVSSNPRVTEWNQKHSK